MVISETFERELARGSGRAALEVMAGNPVEYREVLMRAVAENRPLDRQLESNRAPYLHILLNATGEPAHYVPRLCELLGACTATVNVHTYAELAMLLARDGFNECRRALYAAHARFSEQGEIIGYDDIIRLDGIEGFKFVAAHVPSVPDSEDNSAFASEAYWAVDALRERDGKRSARTAIRAAMASPGVADLFSLAVEDWRLVRVMRQQNRQIKFEKIPSYLEMLDIIAQHGLKSSQVKLWQWTKYADTTTLGRLAADLLAETDHEHISRRLHGFRSRAFPPRHREASGLGGFRRPQAPNPRPLCALSGH